MTSPHDSQRAPESSQSERYEIHELLGRGGMARVYRATDRSTGQQVALKQLTAAKSASGKIDLAGMFEREFHTLSQLRHPHVIAVYDYGCFDDGSPYYTMELLDGADLRTKSPLPYRDACRLLLEVCSSLALLHSRRLLHRDLSPRNIWCTRDGRAKLIDFGAMAPMSWSGGEIVGTPAFIAPETLHRLALDARTDLYSLGVTLYFALTGQVPYPARTFSDVLNAWNGKAVPPSSRVPGLPVALDDLVMSLISMEPSRRPPNAFSVMQQLAACAGLPCDESAAVSQAYLVTPTLVGRGELLSLAQQKLRTVRTGRGAALRFHGQPGVGRSRLLDACVLEAKLQKFTTVRATASGTREPFAVAQALAQHLLDALPNSASAAEFPDLLHTSAPAPSPDTPVTEPLHPRIALKNLTGPELDRARIQHQLYRLFLKASLLAPLFIAVDDVHRIDSQSAAVLAALIDKARRVPMLIVLTQSSDGEESEALRALCRRCEAVEVDALTTAQTHELLEAMFGNAAHLGALSDEIHRLALGNPRQCIDLAQYLVDRGTIRYAAGAWTLPKRLSSDILPQSAAEATRARVAALSAHAKFLAEAHALAFHEALGDDDYRALLPNVAPRAVEAAVSELLMLQALVKNGDAYTIAHRLWATAFLTVLTPEELRERHAALADMYAGKSTLARIHHSFAGGLTTQGLELMIRNHERYAVRMDHNEMFEQNIGKAVWCTSVAIEVAKQLGRSQRQIYELRRWRYAGGIATGEGTHDESAQLWRERLVHDSGLDLYRLDQSNAEPMARLMTALTAAQQRYVATAEHERVYAVDEAIRGLAEYVVYSIAVGARTQDVALVESLPGLLEPFAPLSPVLDAIWKNAIATALTQCHAKFDQALEYWREVYTTLENLSGDKPPYIEPLQNAVAYAIGLMECQIGLASATRWAELLDRDPYQRISALTLQKLVRLEQGDIKGAERFQRQADVLSLQLSAPQMFKSLLGVELLVYMRTRDLAALQRVIEDMQPMAARYPGWVPNLIAAEGSFHLVRGDFAAAKLKYAQCIELTQPGPDGFSLNLGMWLTASVGMAEVLLATGELEEAHAVASAALEVCRQRDIRSPALELGRTVALIEGRLNRPNATRKLEELIEYYTQLGVTGLRLGLAYEARAHLALLSGDSAGFEHYAQLTAREYRHGAGCALGARYERLMNEAARVGFQVRFSLTDFVSSSYRDTSGTEDVVTMVTRSMAHQRRSKERAQLALQLICSSLGASAGHLYLMSSGRLLLRASHGADRPEPRLTQLAREHMDRQRADFDAMDTAADDEPAQSSAVVVGDVTYQLIPLSCITDGAEVHIVGLAALCSDEPLGQAESEHKLLNALAAHLQEARNSSRRSAAP